MPDFIKSLILVKNTYPYCKPFLSIKERQDVARDFWNGLHWLVSSGVKLPPELEKCIRLEKQH